MFCLVFYFNNLDIFYVGFVSGGFWKFILVGVGVEVWECVFLGYLVLGVSSIVINLDNLEEMYIGIGEVYNYIVVMFGVFDWFIWGLYGMGILKIIDGGFIWEKVLDWFYEEMWGVWDVFINL